MTRLTGVLFVFLVAAVGCGGGDDQSSIDAKSSMCRERAEDAADAQRAIGRPADFDESEFDDMVAGTAVARWSDCMRREGFDCPRRSTPGRLGEQISSEYCRDGEAKITNPFR